MPSSGEVPISASDYDAGSSDNCGEVIFRIIRSADNPTNIPPLSDQLIMNCDDVPGNGVALQVWVGDNGTDLNGNSIIVDEERNWDFCEVLMDVQDPMNVCGIAPNTSSIYGVIERETGDPFAGLTMEMEDLTENTTLTAETTQNGLFGFNNLISGNTIQVRPVSGNDYMNGVNTIDLIMIQKHILGLEPLETRQQKVSADVNRDNKISAFDILDLRKLILGIYDKLPTNNSWRFMSSSLDYNSNWYDYQEYFSIEDILPGINDEAGFYAMKIGDVNETAETGLGTISEDRGKNTLIFEADFTDLNTGVELVIPVTSSNFNKVEGFQYTIEHNGYELLEIRPGVIPMSNNNYANFGDYTTMSWNHRSALNFDRSEVLFSLVFVQNREIDKLFQILQLSSKKTAAEAYNEDGIVNVLLKSKKSEKAEILSLEQNSPNPWSRKTTINFNLPNEGIASLKVLDINNHEVYSYKKEFMAGKNGVSVNRAQIGLPGVYIIQLAFEGQLLTRKMVMLN
jgi:hypothetical protein